MTIKNGAIRQFDVGLSLPEVSRNRLTGLRVFDNAILGMDLDLSDHSVIENSSFTGNGADFEGPGIFLIGSHHNRLSNNLVARNGGSGLFQFDSNDNRIEDNSFVANPDGACHRRVRGQPREEEPRRPQRVRRDGDRGRPATT